MVCEEGQADGSLPEVFCNCCRNNLVRRNQEIRMIDTTEESKTHTPCERHKPGEDVDEINSIDNMRYDCVTRYSKS